MESSTQDADELTTVEADIESTLQRLYHLLRRRNFFASPLLRLPTELILKIFRHVIEQDDKWYIGICSDIIGRIFDEDGSEDDESRGGDKCSDDNEGSDDEGSDDEGSEDDDATSDDDDGSANDVHQDSEDDFWSISQNRPTVQFDLIGICHKLRKIGSTPILWGTINLADPSYAESFLEKCNYKPHIIIRPRSFRDWRAPAWVKLQGSTFNNLSSLFFEGTQSEFKVRFVPILQMATKLSVLDVRVDDELQLPWHPRTPTPNLSILRLRGLSMSWTSPLLRNLTRLTMKTRAPFEHTPIDTFLTALANCPDLESLNLGGTKACLPSGLQDDRNVVVRLNRLRSLSLSFKDASTIGCVLSHIAYPESARVKASVSVGGDKNMSELISQAIPRDTDTFRHFQRSKELALYLEGFGYEFSTDKTRRLEILWADRPRDMFRIIRNTLEVVGGDTIISLFVGAWGSHLTEKNWEVLLRGLPRLERIRFHCERGAYSGAVNPFVSIFHRPFGGNPVCPELQRLKVSGDVLNRDLSVTLLERALIARGAYAGSSGKEAEGGDVLTSPPSRVVDKRRPKR